MFQRIILFLLLAICSYNVNAQNKKNRKKVTTTRITKAPKIDGLLNDSSWKNAEILTDFITFRPDNGKPVSAEYQTTVKVI